MYTLITAYTRLNGHSQPITEAAVGSSSIRQLLTDNSLVTLILEHPTTQARVSLDLFTLIDEFYSEPDTLTVGQWLINNGNAALPTGTDLVLSQSTAKFNDAFQAKYTVNSYSGGNGPDTAFAKGRDLILQKPYVDYVNQFGPNILATVNGLFHFTDANAIGGIIHEGAQSAYKANLHEIGLIDTTPIGGVELIPITPEMITSAIPNGELKDGVIITLPKSISGYTVALSIAGFLHHSYTDYSLTGSNLIHLKWNQIPIGTRYTYGSQLMDLTPYKQALLQDSTQVEGVDFTQANTDRAILAYLTLSQSFIILFKEGVSITREALTPSLLPGIFYSDVRPGRPLQLDTGTVPSYRTRKASGTHRDRWSLHVHANFASKLASETFPISEVELFTKQRVSSTINYYTRGYYVNISDNTLKPPV